MTIQLQIGHTYRNETGDQIGPMLHTELAPTDFPFYAEGHVGRWAEDGTGYRNNPAIFGSPFDLVREDTPTATGPVRQVTVTRTEIVPGTYGEIAVAGFEANRFVRLGFHRAVLNAEELDAAAATLTQLANALRAIAAEKEQVQ